MFLIYYQEISVWRRRFTWCSSRSRVSDKHLTEPSAYVCLSVAFFPGVQNLHDRWSLFLRGSQPARPRGEGVPTGVLNLHYRGHGTQPTWPGMTCAGMTKGVTITSDTSVQQRPIWCVKNAFGISVYSKEYTFPNLLPTVAFECLVLQLPLLQVSESQPWDWLTWLRFFLVLITPSMQVFE
jgi:hypothetical protein